MTKRITFFKVGVFIAALLPLLHLAWRAYTGNLGSNPVEAIEHQTGEWSLRMLLLTLAITPLRQWTNRPELLHVRRMLGLFAFFYALLHFAAWLVFDHFFDWNEIAKDIVKRPYITFGFSAFVLLIPLAITSNNFSIRKLGKRWKKLHRLVYVIGGLAVFHFLWLVKADFREPLIYAYVLLVLLIVRTTWWNFWRERWATIRKPATK